MIVSGFCKEVFRELPMEFAVEAQKLLRCLWKDRLDKAGLKGCATVSVVRRPALRAAVGSAAL